MNEKTYTTIDGVMLTQTELFIAFALLTVKSMTVAEAAAVGSRRNASSTPDVKGLSYAECAHGYTACQILILAGIAEWANKTRSAIRMAPDGFDVADEITKAYTQWADASGSPDVAACTVASATEAEAICTVGTLVTYKRTGWNLSTNGGTQRKRFLGAQAQRKRLGVVVGVDPAWISQLVQVNWGEYGTFWDRIERLEVLNESR